MRKGVILFFLFFIAVTIVAVYWVYVQTVPFYTLCFPVLFWICISYLLFSINRPSNSNDHYWDDNVVLKDVQVTITTKQAFIKDETTGKAYRLAKDKHGVFYQEMTVDHKQLGSKVYAPDRIVKPEKEYMTEALQRKIRRDRGENI